MKKTVSENKDIKQQDEGIVLQFTDEGSHVIDLRQNDDDETPLTDDDRDELIDLEQTIGNHIDGFHRVGSCLATIRKKRLYREQYDTFEEYCLKVWKFSKTHANRLIFAAEVAKESAPIGVKITKESQVRCLNGFDAEERSEVYKDAKIIAGEGDVEPKHLQQATAKKKAAKATSMPTVTVPETKKEEFADNVLELTPAPTTPMPLSDILALVMSAHAKAKKLKGSEQLCSDLSNIEVAIQAHVEQQQQAIAA